MLVLHQRLARSRWVYGAPIDKFMFVNPCDPTYEVAILAMTESILPIRQPHGQMCRGTGRKKNRFPLQAQDIIDPERLSDWVRPRGSPTRLTYANRV